MEKIKKSKEKQKRKEPDKKEDKPFVQVDKNGDPISNFISNFRRQFKSATPVGLGKLSELFKLLLTKLPPIEKVQTKPSDIMGTVKTVLSFANNSSVDRGKMNQSKTLSLGIQQSNTNETQKKQEVETQRKSKDIKPKLRL